MAAFLLPPRERKQRTFRSIENNLKNLTDAELRARYRFGSESIAYLCDLLGDSLRRSTNKSTAMSVEQQVTIALRFYASGSFLQVVGDTLGFDKSTVSRTIDNVTNALLALQDRFIVWPCTLDEKNKVKTGFFRAAQMPNVLGCIDGTHVRIQAPSEDEAAFVNRKGYHSINVQAVCDHEGKFTNINANWPGSTHDAHVFRTSNLCQHLEETHRSLEDGYLLGDSGYPCRPFLLTPYSRQTEPYMQRFNRSHTSTRSMIERVFAVWKRRFHVLHSEIRMCPEKTCRIIGACAILHNIALQRNEPVDNDDEMNQQQAVPVPDFQGQNDGRAIRDHIARSFF